MRGYLHRLVHAVSQPRETVHPRTGSLFAPYRSAPGSPSEWIEQSETVTKHPARPESNTAGEFGGSARAARSGELQPPPLFETADAPEHRFAAGGRAEASRGAVTDSRREAEAENHELLIQPTRSEAASDAETHELLIQPTESETASAWAESPRSSTEAASKREARAKSPGEGRPARAERQPDEIQIHIGRIEVTAIQPAAPRAPKPPDKGISLDAYLERRNGRGR